MKTILLLSVLLAAASPAFAAFKSASDAVSPEAVWNPRPLNDDIILPMPCGQRLALRPVAVPSGALIRDKSFSMGIANPQNQDRQLYERKFTGYIAAPFTLNDLPAAWKQKVKLAQKDAARDAWYFIGKYEVSRMQWDAVMNALARDGSEDQAMCPKAGQPGSNLPVTGISWFDAQEFLNKYNAWLVRTHVRDLPSFSDTRNVAFLRLPTEEEWEYAARGGSRVPPEWWANQDIFPLEEGKSLKDYAVSSQDGAKQSPLGIGSREPNPLGIYDTAGNASEMVDGFFRMSIADMANGQVVRRLHGAAGGILTKGGSFRSFDESIMPGARDEVPLYTATGPSSSPDLGLRVVLAGLNIPNAQRLTELRKEAGSQKLKTGAPEIKGDTPMEMVEGLAAAADAGMKENLERLASMLRDQDAARNSQDLKNLEQSFRSLLYQSETLRAFAFRYLKAVPLVDKMRAMLSQQLPDAVRKKAKDAVTAGEKDLKDYMQSLQMGANYYKATLDAISHEPQKELDRLFEQMRREYGRDSVFDEHMRHNIDVAAKYLEQVRKRGISALDERSILRGILPENHFKALKM